MSTTPLLLEKGEGLRVGLETTHTKSRMIFLLQKLFICLTLTALFLSCSHVPAYRPHGGSKLIAFEEIGTRDTTVAVIEGKVYDIETKKPVDLMFLSFKTPVASISREPRSRGGEFTIYIEPGTYQVYLGAIAYNGLEIKTFTLRRGRLYKFEAALNGVMCSCSDK
ncbi:hypothetical protein HUU42_02875 [bacterium]|nr:hypothetical protein [bacterium]